MKQVDLRKYLALAGTAMRLMAFHNSTEVHLRDVLANLPDPVPVPEGEVEALLDHGELLTVEDGIISLKHPFTTDL